LINIGAAGSTLFTTTSTISVLPYTKYIISFNLLDSQGCSTNNFKTTSVNVAFFGSNTLITIAPTSGIAPTNYFFNQFKTCDRTVTYPTAVESAYRNYVY
jgi:hypothetical protein